MAVDVAIVDDDVGVLFFRSEEGYLSKFNERFNETYL